MLSDRHGPSRQNLGLLGRRCKEPPSIKSHHELLSQQRQNSLNCLPPPLKTMPALTPSAGPLVRSSLTRQLPAIRATTTALAQRRCESTTAGRWDTTKIP